MHHTSRLYFFFFNDTATTEIYTLSLHDALPISRQIEHSLREHVVPYQIVNGLEFYQRKEIKDILAYLHLLNNPRRSEEHTSELQSPCNLVCRLLLEKKKNKSESTIRQRSSEHRA